MPNELDPDLRETEAWLERHEVARRPAGADARVAAAVAAESNREPVNGTVVFYALLAVAAAACVIWMVNAGPRDRGRSAGPEVETSPPHFAQGETYQGKEPESAPTPENEHGAGGGEVETDSVIFMTTIRIAYLTYEQIEKLRTLIRFEGDEDLVQILNQEQTQALMAAVLREVSWTMSPKLATLEGQEGMILLSETQAALKGDDYTNYTWIIKEGDSVSMESEPEITFSGSRLRVTCLRESAEVDSGSYSVRFQYEEEEAIRPSKWRRTTLPGSKLVFTASEKRTLDIGYQYTVKKDEYAWMLLPVLDESKMAKGCYLAMVGSALAEPLDETRSR